MIDWLNAEFFETIEQGEVVFVGKESEDRFGHDFADARHFEQFGFSRIAQRVEALEVSGEIDGGLAADMANADGRDKFREWRILAGLDIVDELVGGNFCEAIERFNLTGGPSIKISNRANEAGVDQCDNVFLAETLNIQCGFARVIFNGAL